MRMIKSRKKSTARTINSKIAHLENEKNEKETQNEISNIKDGRFAAGFWRRGRNKQKNHAKNKRTTHKKAKIGSWHTCFDNDTFHIVYSNVNGT